MAAAALAATSVRHLLLLVVLRLWAVRRVLKGQLRLRLVDVLLIEVLVIIIEYLVVAHVEVLARVQGPTLVTLVALRQLLLGRDVEIAGGHGELLHVGLRVHVLDALIYNVVDRARVLLVLRLREVLELVKTVLLADDGVAYQLLTLGG